MSLGGHGHGPWPPGSATGEEFVENVGSWYWLTYWQCLYITLL